MGLINSLLYSFLEHPNLWILTAHVLTIATLSATYLIAGINIKIDEFLMSFSLLSAFEELDDDE